MYNCVLMCEHIEARIPICTYTYPTGSTSLHKSCPEHHWYTPSRPRQLSLPSEAALYPQADILHGLLSHCYTWSPRASSALCLALDCHLQVLLPQDLVPVKAKDLVRQLLLDNLESPSSFLSSRTMKVFKFSFRMEFLSWDLTLKNCHHWAERQNSWRSWWSLPLGSLFKQIDKLLLRA